MPRSPAIIARLIALLGHPFADESRGVHVLKLMNGLCPILEMELVTLWDTMIPHLLQYLKGRQIFPFACWIFTIFDCPLRVYYCIHSETGEDKITFSQKNWEDMCLKLLSKSLDEMNKDDWTLKIGNVLLTQLHLYNDYPKDKVCNLSLIHTVLAVVDPCHGMIAFTPTDLTNATPVPVWDL